MQEKLLINTGGRIICRLFCLKDHQFSDSMEFCIIPSLTPKKPQSQCTSRIPALFLSREMRNAAYMALCQSCHYPKRVGQLFFIQS